MNKLEHLTIEEVEAEIDWASWELEAMRESHEERNAKWYIREKALQHHKQRFDAEWDRRAALEEELERYGSINLKSEDPAQLSLPI